MYPIGQQRTAVREPELILPLQPAIYRLSPERRNVASTDAGTCVRRAGRRVGGVATGDGSTRHDSTTTYGIAGIALLGAAGAFLARRRLSRQS